MDRDGLGDRLQVPSPRRVALAVERSLGPIREGLDRSTHHESRTPGMKIRNRILGTYLLVSLVLLAVAGGLLYDSVSDEARRGIETRLQTGARVMALQLEQPGVPTEEATLDLFIDKAAVAADARLTVIAPDGRVVADSEFDGPGLAALDNHNGRAEVVAAREAGEGASTRYSRSLRIEVVYHARRVEAGAWAGSISRMAVPLNRVLEAQAEARRELLFSLVIALALALLAGVIAARRLSRPIADLRRAAHRIARGEPTARVHVQTGDELEDLAGWLDVAANRLADRVELATAERNQMEGVLEGMVEGVMVVDGGGKVVLANAALNALLGLDRTVTGRTVMEATRHAGVADVMGEVVAETVGPISREIRVSYPVARVLLLHAKGLETGGAVAVFHDVTALKRVDEVRRDFVSSVSHELKTPLATLAAHAEAMTDVRATSEEMRESADAIRRSVNRLAELVDDLLKLSRLEDEGFTPEFREFPVGDLIRALMEEWQGEAEARRVELETEVEEGLVATGDRNLLRQALGNLLDNALKHGSQGGTVRISAHALPDSVELAVSDDGPGIPPEDLPRLFERFYRVEKGRSREGGGTGLGLAIVKHVAEVHGGKVEVESTPGVGSTFRLEIPA